MNHKLSAVVLVLIIALGIYAFFALFERYEATEDLGWDRAALRNPYQAASLFLRRLDVDVQSSNTFDKLIPLPENGTMMIGNSSHVLSDRQVHTLNQWVSRGGHLIVGASSPASSESDLLLARFGVENRASSARSNGHLPQDPMHNGERTASDERARPREHRTSFPPYTGQLNRVEPSTGQAANETDRDAATTPENELSVLWFEGIEQGLNLHFIPSRTLYHRALHRQGRESSGDARPIYWAGDEHGIHFLQLAVGQGLLSVLSDSLLWQSDQIAKFDHAFFLRTLARDVNGARILYGTRMPSLFTLIWRHASPLVIASALWLVAWLIYRGRRFGPIVQQQIGVRRSLAEHVSASANYLWRGGWREALLAPVREDIRRHAHHAIPNYEQLDDATRYRHLSAYSGISPERIEDAMGSDGKQSVDHFVETIQCLQHIRTSL